MQEAFARQAEGKPWNLKISPQTPVAIPVSRLRLTSESSPGVAFALKGRTVDISESGISAMLTIEAPLCEVVELSFTLPDGPVTL